ncbi:MAG: pyridoxamine 5'-phosphate oxidase family protein [Nitrososphaerales archaeon]
MGEESRPVELSKAERNFVKSKIHMYVGTISKAGYPRVTPMRVVNSSTALYYVLTDTTTNPQKVANLNNSSKVAAIIHEMGRTPKGIHVQGIATILNPKEAKEEYIFCKNLFEERHDYYKANNISFDDSVVKLEIKHKRSWGL